MITTPPLITMVTSALKQQWKLLLFVLFFLPILLSLGFWQLDRAEQKRELLSVYQQQQTLPPLLLTDVLHSRIKPYQNVIVEGHYNNQQYWLLDNRSRQGRAGYEIIMPLWTGQQWLLVNRGWIAAPLKRDQLPTIANREQRETVLGYLHIPSENVVVKNSASDWYEQWPQRVLHINMEKVAQILDGPVFPALLRIDSENQGAFNANWPVINTRPEKHTAYAVQWFSMAFVLLLLYGWVMVKLIKQTNNI